MNEPPGPHDEAGTILAALVEACPSFADDWRAHRASTYGDVGVYADMAVFAKYLVSRLDRGETTEFPAVFEAVEGLLRSDDAGVRYAVQFGLLEDLGNVAANRHGWPFAARFKRWFGPTTATAWTDLHRMWGTSDTG